MSGYDDWIGRSQTQVDRLEVQRAQAMQAALGLPEPALQAGDPLPGMWHLLYFWDVQPPQDLGRDGHPALGGFLPAVGLPRRMWAGERLIFNAPLILGEEVERVSTIKSVAEKQGRSGKLAFVTVEHRFNGDALIEEHDIVYREDPGAGPSYSMPRDAPPGVAEWRESRKGDTTLLFRYSALTFNGHRIHYDLDYARKVEHYPGLVVHGPLMATMMLAAGERALGAAPLSFQFQAKAPVFHGEPFALCGRRIGEGQAELWVEKDGRVCLLGEAVFASPGA